MVKEKHVTYVLFNHENYLINHSGYSKEIVILTYFSVHNISAFVINKSPSVEIR